MTTLQTMYPPQVNSPATSTTGAMTTGQTTVNVLDASVLPDAPNLLVFGADKTSPETVLMTDKTGNTLTITRAVQGVAQSWGANTVVGRYFTAIDLSTVQENIQTLNADKVDEDDLATVATSGSYDDLGDVPESFTPSTHTHTKSQVTDFPSSMPPTAHKDSHKTGGDDALTPGDIGAQTAITASGILKGNGSAVSAATAGTDYVAPSALDDYLAKSGGTMSGDLTANNPAVADAKVRNISAGTTDLTAGSSTLATGALYFVYE